MLAHQLKLSLFVDPNTKLICLRKGAVAATGCARTMVDSSNVRALIPVAAPNHKGQQVALGNLTCVTNLVPTCKHPHAQPATVALAEPPSANALGRYSIRVHRVGSAIDIVKWLCKNGWQ